MKESSTIVFVEVKYRNSQNYGHAAESVTRQKQHRLIKAANWWMLKQGLNADAQILDLMWSLFIAMVSHIEWIKNAITEG